ILVVQMERGNVTRRTTVSSGVAPFGNHKIVIDRTKNISGQWRSNDRRTHANVNLSLLSRGNLFDKGQPVRYRMGKDVGVEDDNHPHDSAQSNGMPYNKPEYLALIPDLIGCGCGHDDRLCIYHLAHHATGAVGGAHQDGIKVELLRRNTLQAP